MHEKLYWYKAQKSDDIFHPSFQAQMEERWKGFGEMRIL